MKGFNLPRLESGKVQVGVQAYNILNHPNFQNPGFNFSAPVFATITQTASSPTSFFGSFLGGDASPRILQLKAVFSSEGGEKTVKSEVSALCPPELSQDMQGIRNEEFG